jgi:hypothetical protein
MRRERGGAAATAPPLRVRESSSSAGTSAAAAADGAVGSSGVRSAVWLVQARLPLRVPWHRALRARVHIRCP